jgi:hypothetical protein
METDFSLRVFAVVGIQIYVGATCLAKKVMKITTIFRFGVAALAMGAFFGVSLPVRADQLVWVRAQPLNYFKVRGLVPPGSYSHEDNQKPATIAVNKAGQGVGEQKQTTSKLAKKRTRSTLALQRRILKVRSGPSLSSSWRLHDPSASIVQRWTEWDRFDAAHPLSAP